MSGAKEFADELIGTALGSYDQEFTEWSETASIEELEEFDELCFLCESCNWYCSTDELNEGQICDDCKEDKDEE